MRKKKKERKGVVWKFLKVNNEKGKGKNGITR